MARFSGDWERDFRSQWARTDSHGGERILGKGEVKKCTVVGTC